MQSNLIMSEVFSEREILGKQIKEKLLDSHITVAQIPLAKIVLVVAIITLTQLLRGLFFSMASKELSILLAERTPHSTMS